ncbi:unnamed protein product [Knipowitschia caucasica]|uniref:ZP domain-containing protein n=1 Tax=Knipowitschia caucasica TaxID=637954 RepID=A0AAV2LV96_KNICA
MEASAQLLFLIAAFFMQGIYAQDFYGHSLTFLPPQRNLDGTTLVGVVSRDNGRLSCPAPLEYTCGDSGVCTNIDADTATVTTNDGTGQQRWCQSEQDTSITVTTGAKSLSLSSKGCCWLSNVENVKDWSAVAQMDLGQRSDTFSINHCPVSATVSSMRVPQNCFSKVSLLAHDPDGDEVKCSLTSTTPTNIVLDENKCVLSSTGALSTGVHVFEVLLEDFPIKNIDLNYPDGKVVQLNVSNPNLSSLCSVKLLFSIEVLPPLPSCELGHVQPMFLSKTPSQGSLLYASGGKTITIVIEAQAQHNSIKDFQVSGPRNMTKVFSDHPLGKAAVTLSWTPHHQDLYRHVPICFTAETDETQSEMRCAVIVVTKSTITQGNAIVKCQADRMTVSLEKASVPGIDENFLKLLDPSCSLTFNSTHIMGAMTYSTCGTKVEDKGDFIVFFNEIDSFELPTEIITRRRKVKLGFSCQFPKFLSISTHYNVHTNDYIFTESTFGSFQYAFEIYKDAQFTEKVQPNEYPVEIELFQNLYMCIRATSELQNVKMFVESCRGTPDENPDNTLFYDLTKDGCSKDETFNVAKSTDDTYCFQVQSFKFNGNNDQVYITCSVILCDKDSPFSRCAQGCVENANQARRRRRRSLSKETEDHRITQGPFIFQNADSLLSSDSMALIADAELKPTPLPTTAISKRVKLTEPGQSWLDRSSESGDVVYVEDDDVEDDFLEIREILASHWITAVFATSFFLAIITMVFLVCYFTKKRRAEDRKMLLESE